MDLNPSELENLPPEIITSILLDLSYDDLLHLCQVSHYLSSFCRNESFWREKAYRDFQFPKSLFDQFKPQEPRLQYLRIEAMINNPNQYLVEGAKDGNVALVRYLIEEE